MKSYQRFCWSIKWKSGTASVNTDRQWSKQQACFACATRCGTLSITTPASLLANELIVRSVLHRQVSLAAANHIYVIYEAMKGCKNLKVH